jgi:hypothetical protein
MCCCAAYVQEDVETIHDLQAKERERIEELRRLEAGESAVALQALAAQTLDYGISYPDKPPQFTHMGPNSIARSSKMMASGFGDGSKPIRRIERNRLVLPSKQAFLLMASQSGVGRDEAGEEVRSCTG